MADISKININNFDYDLKDNSARQDLNTLKTNIEDTLCNIRFGFDENGEAGYYVGDDTTLRPFRNQDELDAAFEAGKMANLPTAATLDNAGNLIVKNENDETLYTTTFTNNYNKGKADGDVKHKVYASAYRDPERTFTYLYVDGKCVSSNSKDGNTYTSVQTSTLSI